MGDTGSWTALHDDRSWLSCLGSLALPGVADCRRSVHGGGRGGSEDHRSRRRGRHLRDARAHRDRARDGTDTYLNGRTASAPGARRVERSRERSDPPVFVRDTPGPLTVTGDRRDHRSVAPGRRPELHRERFGDRPAASRPPAARLAQAPAQGPRRQGPPDLPAQPVRSPSSSSTGPAATGARSPCGRACPAGCGFRRRAAKAATEVVRPARLRLRRAGGLRGTTHMPPAHLRPEDQAGRLPQEPRGVRLPEREPQGVLERPQGEARVSQRLSAALPARPAAGDSERRPSAPTSSCSSPAGGSPGCESSPAATGAASRHGASSARSAPSAEAQSLLTKDFSCL